MTTSTDLTAIRLDEFLPHPPEKVWRALVDPVRLAKWLGPNDFQPEVGHRFQIQGQAIPSVGFSGVVQCEVLELRPLELLRLSWCDADPDNTVDWRVSWRLQPEGHGTRLFLEHTGFDPDDPRQQLSRTIMDGGWRQHVIRRLIETLGEAGPSGTT
jgi:uncharacterized protein YndB with AHSA1/START domain